MHIAMPSSGNITVSESLVDLDLKYAGIGSRDLPEPYWIRIIGIGSYLRKRGFTCVTGGAKGADDAFAQAARDQLVMWRPHHATEDAYEIAESFHPNWDACSPAARGLHARNSMILLGADCQTPVKFVVAYTEKGKATGGTGQGLRIARAYNIPIYNLGSHPDEDFVHFRNWFSNL